MATITAMLKDKSILIIGLFTVLLAFAYSVVGEVLRQVLSQILPPVLWTAGIVIILVFLVLGGSLICLRIGLTWTRLIEMARDRRLAEIEAEDRQTELDAKQALTHAALIQMQTGIIYPSNIEERKFAHIPNLQSIQHQLTSGEVESQDVSWPEMVRLFDLLPAGNGNLDNIILGINVDEQTGKQTIIQTPLEDMVHCAYGGETGTGKSTLAYSVAYQIATAPQDAQLILADTAGTTWKTLANCDRLMYPIISSENDCLHVLNELHKEVGLRTDKLFAPYPTVEKLSEYNAVVPPGDRLGYIAMLIDELPEYLENNEIEVMLRRLIRKSRKAGIYIFGMGTSWKHTDLDTSIKRQFRTKVHFAASDVESSRVLLGSRMAADIKQPGRAYARLPFETSADLIEIQTAYIDKAEAMTRLANPTILDLPVSESKPTFAEQAVIDARQNGTGLKECYRIFAKLEYGEAPNSVGGTQTNQIKDILKKWGFDGA